MKSEYTLIEIKPKDKIGYITGNREVNASSVAKLKTSMERWGILTTITVTKYRNKYFIIDGQHRHAAAKELGLILPAIVVPRDSLNVIIDLNTIQKNWSLDNYVDFFASNVDKDLAEPYEILKDIHVESGLNYTALCRIYSKGGLTAFKRGELELDNMEFAFSFINYLAEIAPYVPFAKSARFIDGYIRIVKNENYSHTRMITKLKLNEKRQKYSMDGESKPSSYGRLMQDIYNLNQSKNLVMFHKW